MQINIKFSICIARIPFAKLIVELLLQDAT